VRPTRLSLTGSGGLPLAADRWGDPGAPAVLLLHGGGQTRHAWAGTCRALAAEGHCCVALDQRGHGESGWAPDGDYALDAFVADLEAVLAALARPPVVVGASLGGLATLLAAGESDDFRGRAVVLVDVAPRLEPEGTGRIIRFMTGRPDGFASLEEAADAVAAYTRQRAPRRDLESLKKNLRQSADGRWRWHWDPAFLGPGGPSALLDRERLLAAARGLARPALLVRGRESDVLSEEGAAELVAALPDAELVDVSGAGHMVAGDRNDAFTRAVSDFVRRCAASSC
jgi:pimeloyl-ACP methyl ester carboxylesterase